MTARPKSAARLPSMTRWSNVTETFPIVPRDDLAVADDRALLDPVDPEDRDLGMVDERRDEEAGGFAGARDRERAAAELLRLERPGVRGLGEAPHLGVELVERERVGAVDDRNDEALLRLDGDAEVVAVEQHELAVLDARVELRELLQRLDDGLEDERDEALEVDAGEVALLDPRHGRDLVRARQVLEHLALDAAQLNALAFGRGRAAGCGAHVLLGDPPLRTGARDTARGRRRARPRLSGSAASRELSPLVTDCDLLLFGREPVPREAARHPQARARSRRRRSRRAPCRPGRRRPPRRESARRCRPPATGSRPSSCRSRSRRAARPRRSPGPPRRASGRSRPRSAPRRDPAA